MNLTTINPIKNGIELDRREANVYSFIKDLYNILEVADKVAMQKLVKKHRVSSTVPTILKKGGIIKSTTRGCYEWSSVPPTAMMAKECTRRERDYQKARQQELKDKKAKKESEEVLFEVDGKALKVEDNKKTQMTGAVIKLLWGLITIRIKFLYK